MIWEELDESLILLDVEGEAAEEVLEKIGSVMIQTGYCKDSYVQALKERERDFPTGINIGSFGIAIPHTDKQHVNKGGVAIGQLKKPVRFFQMGTTDEPVEARLIFMLAVDDPQKHMPFLQKILQVVQDEFVLKVLTLAKSKREILQIIREKENLLD